MKMPERGRDRAAVLAELEEFRRNDLEWRGGRVWAYVYDAGREVEEVGKQAFTSFMTENALDPTAFPSLLRLENEVVAMAAAHLGGDDGTVGSFTSGGTESILLAVKAARDWAREHRPHVTEPEMVLPVTAHAAFQKAAHYLCVKPVLVPVDPLTFKADVDAIRAAITPSTVLLVGSAVSYAHGVVDPIPDIGRLALERELLFHVDGCIGGFLLPYFRRFGAAHVDFDLTVPGVTSISMDLHKYAFCPKGASVVLYKSAELRRHQIYACSTWTGYTIVNPTVQSTKSGGPLAAAWAVMNHLGDEGYAALARKIFDASKRLIAEIPLVPELRILGTPELCLIAFTSDTVNVFHVIDEMKVRGWYVQPQLGFLGSKENVHLSVTPGTSPWVDPFLADLRASVESAKAIPADHTADGLKESLAAIDPKSLTPEMFSQMLAMAGLNGVELPSRMAGINEMLNALPAPLTETVLTQFVNELFQYKPA